MKDFLTVVRLLWGALASLSMAVVCVLLLYMMWTGQDIENIHVAVIVMATVWSTDKPAKLKDRKPKPGGGP